MNYTYVLSQAEKQEEVYIKPPQEFGGADKLPNVRTLLKSLYGLKHTPKTFFVNKLKAGLMERDFIQSEIDKCLFMKGNPVYLVYVDDNILAGPNLDNVNKEIQGLEVSNKDQVHSFQLRDEGQLGDFLGIRIEKLGD